MPHGCFAIFLQERFDRRFQPPGHLIESLPERAVPQAGLTLDDSQRRPVQIMLLAQVRQQRVAVQHPGQDAVGAGDPALSAFRAAFAFETQQDLLDALRAQVGDRSRAQSGAQELHATVRAVFLIERHALHALGSLRRQGRPAMTLMTGFQPAASGLALAKRVGLDRNLRRRRGGPERPFPRRALLGAQLRLDPLELHGQMVDDLLLGKAILAVAQFGHSCASLEDRFRR